MWNVSLSFTICNASAISVLWVYDFMFILQFYDFEQIIPKYGIMNDSDKHLKTVYLKARQSIRTNKLHETIMQRLSNIYVSCWHCFRLFEKR